ncbi:MAG: hypothetical protein RIB61_13410 [Roseicyclus sp.]
MKHAGWVLLLAATCGAPALAQDCPAGLAGDGVYMRFADRTVLFRHLDDGRTAETEFRFDDTTLIEYRLAPLGLILQSWEMVNGLVPEGEMETVTFEGPPMPAPAPGARWRATEHSVYSDGTRNQYQTSVEVGAMSRLFIGSCSYDMLPITVRRIGPDGASVPTDLVGHLPDLGLSVFLGDSEQGFSQLPDPPLEIGLDPPGAASAAPQPAPAPTK